VPYLLQAERADKANEAVHFFLPASSASFALSALSALALGMKQVGQTIPQRIGTITHLMAISALSNFTYFIYLKLLNKNITYSAHSLFRHNTIFVRFS
jgi:hypothetical protein